jgi:hypothetical protein
MAHATSINPQTTAIPPTVPPAIAPPFEELRIPLPGLNVLTVGPGGLVKVVVPQRRVVDAALPALVVKLELMVKLELAVKLGLSVKLELAVKLELVVAGVVNGASTLLEMRPRIEASPRTNPAEMLLPSLQHELFPQQ